MCLAVAPACYLSHRNDADPDADGDDADAGPLDEGPGCPVWAIPETAGGPPGDGTRDRPHHGLQQAIDRRGDCDHVVLRDGTRSRPFAARVDVPLEAGRDLLIEGDPSAAAPAELDGAGGPGIVVTGGRGGITLRWTAVRNAAADQGGGLRAMGYPRLRLERTEWTGCRATRHGGAVIGVVAQAELVDSVFADNSAGNSGGAVFVDVAAPITIAGCDFLRNRAHIAGGIWIGSAGEVAIERTRFADNAAVAHAGAVFVPASSGSGATDTLTVHDCRFDRNTAGFGPVVDIGVGGRADVRHTVFADSATAASYSGTTTGVLLRGGSAASLDFRNNVVVRNRSFGGLRMSAGSESRIVVGNNTFVDNQWEGGDVRGAAHLSVDIRGAEGVGASIVVAGNLLVGGRGDASARFVVAAGPWADVRHNGSWDAPTPVFDGAVAEHDNRTVEPRFVAPEHDDYRPAPGSPCIDAGDPAPEWNDADGTRNDLGAFGGPDGEWTPLPPGA